MFRRHDRVFSFSHEEGKQGKPLEKSTWHRHRQIHKAVGVILQQYVIDLHAVEVFGNVASILAKNQTFLKLVLSIISYTFLLIILALSPLIPPFFGFPIPSFPLPSKFAVSWAQLINFLFIGFHCRKMFSEIICPQFFLVRWLAVSWQLYTLPFIFLHFHSGSVLMFFFNVFVHFKFRQ